ncbi:polysaccharide deacetylase family protein [Listeria sp. FSL L7-0091]|uniref:Polysaccharide deacetylase family protein n=1 Tax=Listeria farberi TaxID=2713500 RepID=A0A7X1DFD7_9LIST|nr:polysaccharide deacetylase family protein [Listeria farberi]MBC1376220.1 polysaccharide deacetylase family protein [Listeria farberi]MBC1380163.1 polysaccharide deacetylase family protein [Listeria farberi]MBC2262046.1 polysaccharide deacetylase family protein [Listeria farberi]MBC2266394.1 polysaccharide deacetylase family protein [Listeria farberi]MBC2288276.1 polysaccharide deacetylase family protein [Listeria farberi]
MKIRWFRFSLVTILIIVVVFVGVVGFQKYQLSKSRNKVIMQMDRLMKDQDEGNFRRLDKKEDGVEIISYIPKTSTKKDNKIIQQEMEKAKSAEIKKLSKDKQGIIFYTYQKQKMAEQVVSYKAVQSEYIKKGKTKYTLKDKKDICKNIVTDAKTGALLTLGDVLIKNDETKLNLKTVVEQELIRTGDIPLKEVGKLGGIKSLVKWNQTNFELTNSELILPVEIPGISGPKKINVKLADIADSVNKRYLPSSVKAPEIPKAKTNKVIALTFDDGPSASVTPKVLETLKRNNVKATFFVLGSSVINNPGLVKRELEEGHQVGSHSWDHPQLTKLSEKEVYNQILQTQKAVYDQTGYFPTTMRPPYGAVNKKVAEEIGLPIIQWSVDTEDWKNKNPKVVTSRVLSGASNGGIVLMHDIHPTTAASLDKTIKALKKQGYEFVTIDELFGEKLQIGKQYFDKSESRMVK